MKKLNIVKLGYTIQNLLLKKNLVDAKPKDLMHELIDKGYFNNDQKGGLSLRNVLRELDDSNLLYLLPQVRVERKDKNRYWFFNAVEI